MGVGHYLYVVSTAKYMKLIRPKLIKHYGKVDLKSIIREERRRKEAMDYLQSMFDSSQLLKRSFSSGLKHQNFDLPLRNFVTYKLSNSFKGDNKDHSQIDDLFRKDAVLIDDIRADFLRMDQYLGTIDYFGDGQFKVCNTLNIQNFLNYIQVISAAFEFTDQLLNQNKNLFPNQTNSKKEISQRVTHLGHFDKVDSIPYTNIRKEDYFEIVRMGDNYAGYGSAKKMFEKTFQAMKEANEEMYAVLHSF